MPLRNCGPTELVLRTHTRRLAQSATQLSFQAGDRVEVLRRARILVRGGSEARQCGGGILNGSLDREEFSRRMCAINQGLPAPDVDLLIRTGGEQRLSDFLLWESAYAELYFDSCMWPEFSVRRLATAVEEYTRRERRFGGLSAVAAG